MLSRIEKITGLGLLHDVAAAKHTCDKATLIYAENARGKSTFTSLLRSLSTGDTSELTERTTIGGLQPLGARLQFDKGSIHTLSEGGWDKTNPDVIVFDGHFVETNVYSGASVSTQQRQQLLDFALGDKAVAAQKVEGNAVQLSEEAKNKLQAKVAEVQALHPGMTLAEFKALPSSPSFADDIVALQARLFSARNIATIQKAPIATAIVAPALPLVAIFDLLDTTLETVAGVAEGLLDQHLAGMDGGAIDWLASGQPFDDRVTCPYCGQSTLNVPVIQAYQAHFSEVYQALKTSVDDASATLQRALGDGQKKVLAQQVEAANAVLLGWQEHCETQLLSTDITEIWSRVVGVRAAIEVLLDAKRDRMAEYVPPAEARTAVRDAWASVLKWFKDQNGDLAVSNQVIETFKVGLASEQVVDLEGLIETAERSQTRHSAATLTLLAEQNSLINEAKVAEKAKKDARDQLTAVMRTTLAAYRVDTNKYLKELGARFELKMLDKSYVGGARVVYSIELLGEEVTVDGGTRRFETALSESDKRTLAFAFFLASTFADANIGSKVVVIDDPVSSLDGPRKAQTLALLIKIVSSARQLIVLSHGIYFMRDLSRRMSDNKIATTILTIRRAGPIYSGIFEIDIEAECESGYFQQHRIISEFLAGTATDNLKAAQAIRKITEGYMHRRFPGVLDRQLTLGSIVERIKKANPPETLSFASDICEDLENINVYAREFHHETAETTQPPTDEATVTHYCKKALAVIYGEPPRH